MIVEETQAGPESPVQSSASAASISNERASDAELDSTVSRADVHMVSAIPSLLEFLLTTPVASAA